MTTTNNTTTQIQDQQIPEGAAGLCWGGFFLTWIWGIGNKSYQTLWCLVPLVGFVMRFVILFKGRKWAWNNNTWDSVEQFNKTQRTWSIVALVILLISIVAIAILHN